MVADLVQHTAPRGDAAAVDALLAQQIDRVRSTDPGARIYVMVRSAAGAWTRPVSTEAGRPEGAARRVLVRLSVYRRQVQLAVIGLTRAEAV